MSGNSRLLPLSNLSGNWTCWKNNIWIGLIEVLTMILRKPVSAHFYISALHEEFAALGLCTVCYYFIYSVFPLYMYWLCPSRSISPNSAAECFTKKLLRISDCYFRREVACIFPPCCNWSGVLIFRHNYSSIHRPKKKKKKKKNITQPFHQEIRTRYTLSWQKVFQYEDWWSAVSLKLGRDVRRITPAKCTVTRHQTNITYRASFVPTNI